MMRSKKNWLKILIEYLSRLLLKPVYTVYEWKLYREVKKGVMPRHVAIIPDGNRRWAEKMGWERLIGHYYGYNKMKEVLEWLDELGIKIVTLYAMSYENCLYRPDSEKEHLFSIIERGLEELRDYSKRHRVRVKVAGRLDLVPRNLAELARALESETREFSERYLNILLCYGGRQEIVDAFKRIYNDIARGIVRIDEINEEIISKYLYTSHMGDLQEPDLVIRTSGEIRISNFLLWQSAYSELFFCEALWPEFRKIDLLRAIRSYQRRERRFGR
ncbi:MAG: polyprenyl diphosphate synthase [Sulfolobales archaeon]